MESHKIKWKNKNTDRIGQSVFSERFGEAAELMADGDGEAQSVWC